MPDWLAPILNGLPRLNLVALLDICLTAVLIYQFLILVRGRRAVHVMSGVLMLVAVYVLALFLGLDMLSGLMQTVAPYTAFALIVMFQSELRLVLTRLGRRGWLSWGSRLQRREFAEETLLAVEYMAQRKMGALIVLERDIGLRTFIETGVPLDALVSRDLLLAVFHPNAALHDGGVIIQNERVAAAACFLPLSTNPSLASTMGTRHRAAIGITEDTDALALVVSEETGQISAASFGEIAANLSVDAVRSKIDKHFGWTGERAEREAREKAAKSHLAEEAKADGA